MFALKIKGKGYIFPEKFPFVVGKNGDIPANIPFSLRLDMEKGKLVASSDGVFSVNNSTNSLSVLKPGDVIQFCGIELRVERRIMGYIKNFSIFILSGFFLAVISSNFVSRKILNERKISVTGECFVISQEMEYRARMDFKLLPSTIKFLERCVSSLGEKDVDKRDELIKDIGALKSIQDEEFRKLKFEAERAIRNGDISSALKSLQEIKEIIDDPSDERWKYASYRMRELAE
jgi:hypothetical protein